MTGISVMVAVGSTSSVKLQAARRGVAKYFRPRDVGVKVDSGVGSQPLGRETFMGAATRAARALSAGWFDFGVGIEGGIGFQQEVPMGFGVAYVVNPVGDIHVHIPLRVRTPCGTRRTLIAS
jgi:non-canonical (house-cleaning) NTP pyrophosphatase